MARRQTSIQLDHETERRIARLAELWGLPSERNATAVIRQAITQAMVIESARRTLSDSEFVGFLAELYAPIE